MALIAALLIFLILSAATWHVSAACYRSTFPPPPDQAAGPALPAVPARAIVAATLTCFVPFPAGLILELAVWAVAAFGPSGLPGGRAAVLWGYLAAASALSRLVVLGVLSVA